MKTVIAHMDMNTFFVSVERLKDPSLESRPVVVGKTGVRSVVASASYEARRYGIHSAMPMSEAVGRCPDLIVVPPSFRDYQHYHQRIESILADFTPVLEMTSIDEGYLDLTGTEGLWGPPAEAGRRIRRRILEETGLPCSVGVSSNKLVSKVASSQAKPVLESASPPRGGSAYRRDWRIEGVLVVPPGEEAAFLAPLPLSRLPGCGKVTVARLRAMGLDTIGELAARTEEELAAAFGKVGGVLWRRANGHGSQTLATERQRKSISKETTFAEDVRDGARLRSVLHYLTEEVATNLRRRGETARTITLKIRYENFETHTFSRTLPEPTDVTAAIFDAAARMLETRWTRKRPVRLIGVRVSNLMKGQESEWIPSGQADLFAEEDQAAAFRRTTAVDDIRERFGQDSLLTGESDKLLKRNC